MNAVSEIHDAVLKPSPQVVSVPNTLYKSLQGKYFIGQTPPLSVSKTGGAWAALVNPGCSNRELFFNVFTICNFSSSESITAEIWLNTDLPGSPQSSTLVSPTNTVLQTAPIPRCQIQYVASSAPYPGSGINIFDRIVPPSSTLVSEEDGKIIIPPGGNVLLYLKAACEEAIEAIVAFGWWESREHYC